MKIGIFTQKLEFWIVAEICRWINIHGADESIDQPGKYFEMCLISMKSF